MFIREFNQILKLTYKGDYLPNLRANLRTQKADLECHSLEIREKINTSGVIAKIESRILNAENLWGDMKRVKSMSQPEFESYITYLQNNDVLLVDSDIEKSEYSRRVEAYCGLVQKILRQLSEKRAVTSVVFKNDWHELNNNINRNYSLTLPAYLVSRLHSEISMSETLNHVLLQIKLWTAAGRPPHRSYYSFLQTHYARHSSFDQTLEDELLKLSSDQFIMRQLTSSLNTYFFTDPNTPKRPDIDHALQKLSLNWGLPLNLLFKKKWLHDTIKFITASSKGPNFTKYTPHAILQLIREGNRFADDNFEYQFDSKDLNILLVNIMRSLYQCWSYIEDFVRPFL